LTLYIPWVPLHDRVEVAEPPAGTETLAVLREQLSPLDGETETVRLTVPEKPLMLVKVIVEVPVAPVFTVTVVGFSVMEKSWTMKVTVAR
jgi:hypothetical protein